MPEFEDVQHTGGSITIRRRGPEYQLTYTHMRPVPAALAEPFVKADRTPLEFSPITGRGLRDDPPDPVFMAMFASDAEGLFGSSGVQAARRNAASFRRKSPMRFQLVKVWVRLL